MYQHFWTPYAFVRIVIFFIGGILLGIYWPDSIGQTNAAYIFMLLIFIYISLYVFRQIHSRLPSNTGPIGLLAIFIAGYINVLLQTENLHENHLSRLTRPVEYYRAVITSFPEEKNKSWKLEARVQEVNTDQGWKTSTATILLYLSKQHFDQPFQYGDVLLIKGSPNEFTPPANPGEFDYKRFLTFRNIFHQHFVTNEDVVFLVNHPPNLFIGYSIKARLWAEKKLRQFIEGKQEQAIASALVLGVKDGLDNELIGAYAATGAMHVLAVSGLHVAILYSILAFMLKPLKAKKRGRVLFCVISVLILWSYACITGLSPSVLRAVAMFTFVAVAQARKEYTNIYNTLAISAFVLLSITPHLIMSVGFQLSYLAVLGIVYIQRPLYLLVEPKNKVLDWVWKISCVSVAAQVATFSLGLLYFHQFPNYFLFSNLFVIPLALGILVGGLSVLIVSFLPLLASILGIILEWIIKILNFLVFTVESFPFSLIENIYISTFQCWLLMAGIFAILLLLQFRKPIYLYSALCLFLIFAATQWFHFYQNISDQKFVVYNVPGHTAIDIMDCGKGYFFSDTVLLNDKERIRFHIRPNRLRCGVDEVKEGAQFPLAFESSFGKVLVLKGKTFLHITKPNIQDSQTYSADYVIISDNAIKKLDDVLKNVSTKEIILDSSNSRWNCEKLLKESELTSAHKVYSVLHTGAFQLRL